MATLVAIPVEFWTLLLSCLVVLIGGLVIGLLVSDQHLTAANYL
jgi:hypothetical protein